MTNSGKTLLKWAARLIGAVVVAFVYLQWKQVTENYELENGVMGTYRPITLGLAYYLFWLTTRKLDGSADQSANSSSPVSSFALFVCIGIAAGFFAAQLAYVEAVDWSASMMLAKSVGFVAFMVAAGVVIEGLKRIMKWQ